MAQAPPREGRLEGRIPPQDLDAEQSVLGAILIDPTALARVLQLIDASDFYRENHGRIYAACVSLFGDSEPIDNVTVAARLEQQGVLERIGGRAQLALLQESVPTAANVEHYARIVKAKSYKRKLITAGGEVTALGYDDSMDADEALNKATSVVYAAAEDRIQTELAPLTTLLRPAMDRIDAQMASGQGVIGVPSGFYDLDRLTSGFKASDLVIVAGRPAMGKCLTAGTLIDDPETGERVTIERYVNERRRTVWGVSATGDVRPTEVGAWVDSGVKEAFRVRTRTGRTVEVTGHHPFLTATGWQPLHDLVVGDAIAVPRGVPSFGQDAELDPGLVRLLGYLVAEGGLTHASPAFSNTDPEILADFEGIIGRHYPGLHLRHDGRSTWFVSGRWGGRDVNPLTTWLRELGLWGKGALEKRIPDLAWRWDRARLRQFIRALFSCDATVYAIAGYPRIEFTVASRELAEDAQHALTRFGIVSKLWRKTQRSWRVEITDPGSVATYQSEIGWIGEKARRFPVRLEARQGNRGRLPVQTWSLVRTAAAGHGLTLAALAVAAGEHAEGRRGFNPHSSRRLPRARLAAYTGVLDEPHLRRISNPDLYWDEIVSIEAIGRHQVYDLTVPDGANFIAQDVVVHNTSFVLNLALHAAVNGQIPVAVFSLEMSKEQLVERLLCQQAKIDSQRLHRGLLGDAEYERLVMAIGPLENAPIFIDDAPVLDELTLLLKARQAKVRHNIGLVLLDYLQLMQGRGRGDDNRVQEVSQISRSLKGLARELKVPVIAISQLSRAPEARPNKRPMLSDLRESGSIEQDADIVMFLYRDEYYNDKTEKPGIAEVIVAKHRNGPTDTIELRFRKDQTLFYNLESRRGPALDVEPAPVPSGPPPMPPDLE